MYYFIPMEYANTPEQDYDTYATMAASSKEELMRQVFIHYPSSTVVWNPKNCQITTDERTDIFYVVKGQ